MESLAIIKSLTEMDNDLIWFKDNYNDLKEKYNNTFVAIKGGELIAVDSNMSNLIKEIKKKGESPQSVLVQFISKIPMIF